MLHLSEVSSLVVLLIMVWVAVFFNVSRCSANEWDCVFLSFVVFCSNLVFIAMCSYVGCRAFVEKNHLNEKVISMSQLFRKKSSADGMNFRNGTSIDTGKNMNARSSSGKHGRHRLTAADRRSTEFHATMFPEQSVGDKRLGNLTLKMNPLADGLNRLGFAKERAVVEKSQNNNNEVELTVVDCNNKTEI
jgi:hypothetical protein